MKKIDRTGEISTNIWGAEMEIVRYVDNKNVYVYFPQYKTTKKTTYYLFKQGRVYPCGAKEMHEEMPTQIMGDFNNRVLTILLVIGGVIGICGLGLVLSELF